MARVCMCYGMNLPRALQVALQKTLGKGNRSRLALEEAEFSSAVRWPATPPWMNSHPMDAAMELADAAAAATEDAESDCVEHVNGFGVVAVRNEICVAGALVKDRWHVLVRLVVTSRETGCADLYHGLASMVDQLGNTDQGYQCMGAQSVQDSVESSHRHALEQQMKTQLMQFSGSACEAVEVRVRERPCMDEWIQNLIDEHIERMVWVGGNRLSPLVDTAGWALMSGSYNPLHAGHRKLTEVTTALLGGVHVAYELSVLNADKAALQDVQQIAQRIRQFSHNDLPLVLTRHALFTEKAVSTNASAFVVGFDTAARLLDPKYYSNSRTEMIAQLSQLQQQQHIRILVAGRLSDPQAGKGAFLTLKMLDVPTELDSMFVEIPEEMFRVDISSSMIRNSAQK
ncbi:putative nicotinamide mononucleotide adenylyltransferase [Porphyridium purpureum]|uniref:Putative nicotinamide mononucleotide adenylyltransferase n=1 Tax=Porphyridium purpureum TaxID=35688 RepID=A0A5J4YI25_PORPP|nr:putative nicotinamide mononucleotide adenylyltransferase [Porphyridium purpureum]|eukprot:POR3810..scf297_16